MGNTIDSVTRENMGNLYRQILSIECETLDVGNANGVTGYIDYIEQKNLTGPIAKGVEFCGRGFIVWKANCVLTDNKKTKEYQTFTTFFKRYQDSDSVLYHTCGHDGINLFSTEGGCTENQMKFLLKLLKDREVTLNREQIESNRIFVVNRTDISDDATLQITIK
jgi:hypothetical protein